MLCRMYPDTAVTLHGYCASLEGVEPTLRRMYLI